MRIPKRLAATLLPFLFAAAADAQTLQGKLHVTMGTKDTFYFDAAAHRLEQFERNTAATWFASDSANSSGGNPLWLGYFPTPTTMATRRLS